MTLEDVLQSREYLAERRMVDRSSLLETAKCAEKSERYDDMAGLMKQVVDLQPVLSQEERNLLSVAYKNVVGARRSAWRVVSSIETKVKEKKDQMEIDCTGKYKDKIVKELEGLCQEVVVSLFL